MLRSGKKRSLIHSEARRYVEFDLELHDRQLEAFFSPANEILYGGAAGGGKSHFIRALALFYCTAIPGFQFYLFRRHGNDLITNHIHGPNGFLSLLAPLINAGLCEVQQKKIIFSNGSMIWLCHFKDISALQKYQGPEMHGIGIDEGCQFEEEMLRFLRTRNRAPGLIVPSWVYEVAPRQIPFMIIGSNPGGIGHRYLKEGFVKLCPNSKCVQMSDEEGGMLRTFIPARLEDNPSMQEFDPTYEKKLMGLKRQVLINMYRWGSWDEVSGAFFDWNPSIVIPTHTLPKELNRYISYDHGYAAPFSVGWWCIADGEEIRLEDNKTVWYPRDSIIRYREWYGCQSGSPNTGLRMNPSEIAAGIHERSNGESYIYRVADPKIFSSDDGKPIARQFAEAGLKFREGINDRLAGWSQIRERMKGYLAPEGDRIPTVYVMDCCIDSLEIMPIQQADPRKLEDLDTKGEDHIPDEWRYGHMSHFWATDPEEEPGPVQTGISIEDVVSRMTT